MTSRSHASDQAKQRLKSQVFNSKIYEVGNKTCVRVPGFKYDDFNRAGLVDICKLNFFLGSDILLKNLCEESREVDPGFDVVTVGRQMIMTDYLYDHAALTFPMIFSWWPVTVGRSSFDICKTLTDESNGVLLAKAVWRRVAVDRITRKAIPLPQVIRDRLLCKICPGTHFESFDVPSLIPKDAYQCHITVKYADMDFLQHTNQASYIKYMCECAAQASMAGYYSCLHGDIGLHRVVSVETVHVDESFAGDILNVMTWEDKSNTLLLRFIVHKNGRRVCYGKLLFSPSVQNVSRL